MALKCLATQLEKDVNDLPLINCKISVFHSASATFHALSDPSGMHGMRHECIRSTPSWRGCEARRDCAFIVENETQSGMRGMAVVRIILFFLFNYEGIYYPCTLVEWFRRVKLDPVTGM